MTLRARGSMKDQLLQTQAKMARQNLIKRTTMPLSSLRQWTNEDEHKLLWHFLPPSSPNFEGKNWRVVSFWYFLCGSCIALWAKRILRETHGSRCIKVIVNRHATWFLSTNRKQGALEHFPGKMSIDIKGGFKLSLWSMNGNRAGQALTY